MALINDVPQQPALSQQALTELFMRYISDVYHLKQQLTGYLPWMVSQASKATLRINLLNTSSEIRAEMLRLEFICKILNCTINPVDAASPTHFDAEAMLKAQLQGLGAEQVNFTLITHMMFLESMEATSFGLLTRLAGKLRNKTVLDLLKANLQQAKVNREKLNELMDGYLHPAA